MTLPAFRLDGHSTLGPPPLPTPPVAAAPSAASAPPLRLAALIALVVTALGYLAYRLVWEVGLVRPLSNNIFFRLFGLLELPFIAMLAAVALAALLAARHAANDDMRPLAPPSRRAVLALGALTLAVTTAATFAMMHALPFSMDEYSADFQARIFAGGRVAAPVAPEWHGYISTLIPIFTTFDPRSGSWLSMYLPGYAALKAPFVLLGAGGLLNPLLAAAAVLLLAAVARRLWPGDGARQWGALLALVTSSQFLVTSASAYSMPAHLALNLLWLLLWLRGDRASLLAAPLVGVLALGLHNPFPHALFVAPFLLRLLYERRFRVLAWMGAVYLAGSAGWLAWLRWVHPFVQNQSGLLSVFAIPSGSDLWTHAINFTLLLTWQTPVAALAMVVALLGERRLTGPMRDILLGVVATLAFYLFFPGTQGHGWGYRYVYAVLGNIALLAGAGWGWLAASRPARLLAVASLALTVLVQLPLRAAGIERFVRPFAASMDYLTTRDADAVVVPMQAWWYGRDLQRNDPWLRERPLVVGGPTLTRYGYEQLEARFPGRVLVIEPEELVRLGMTPWPKTPASAR